MIVAEQITHAASLVLGVGTRPVQFHCEGLRLSTALRTAHRLPDLQHNAARYDFAHDSFFDGLQPTLAGLNSSLKVSQAIFHSNIIMLLPSTHFNEGQLIAFQFSKPKALNRPVDYSNPSAFTLLPEARLVATPAVRI